MRASAFPIVSPSSRLEPVWSFKGETVIKHSLLWKYRKQSKNRNIYTDKEFKNTDIVNNRISLWRPCLAFLPVKQNTPNCVWKNLTKQGRLKANFFFIRNCISLRGKFQSKFHSGEDLPHDVDKWYILVIN